MRPTVRILTLLALIVLIPTVVSAQAVIAGTVKDTSGAVLPGVTVEATSPALIEKVRTHVTDGTGQYRIEDLRPGTYTVTYTLQGFNTFKREGIELTGTFTATVNVELKVGSLSETITVAGESPIVNIQSARRELTLNNDVLKAIPTARNYAAMVSIVPGVNTNLNDVVTTTATTQFPIHGGRNNEGRMLIDGLNVGNPPGGNQPTSVIVDVGNAQEVTFTTAGGLGESETAGLVMNVVPKTGGNSTTGSVAYAGTGEALQSNNYTDELKAQGLTTPIPLTKSYDLNGAVGGPIKKDRLWYFANGRTQGGTQEDREHLLQPERRRRDEVAVCAGPEQSGLQRPHVREHQPASHLAGVSPQQDHGVLGRAGQLSHVLGSDDRHHGPCARLARGTRCRPDEAAARAAGQLVVAVYEQVAARCRLRRHLLRVGQLRARSESDTRPDQRRRAMCGRMRGERWHPWSGLSVAGLRQQPSRLVPLARFCVRTSPDGRASRLATRATT